MAIQDLSSEVRRLTNEPTEERFTDELLEALVTERGVNGAVVHIWEAKAALYSNETDVTESGATHKFSDLYKNAAAEAQRWRKKISDEAIVVPVVSDRVRVKKIERL